MMATTVEAILGAVHLNGGDEALASVMTKLGLTSDLLVTFTIPQFFFMNCDLHIYNSAFISYRFLHIAAPKVPCIFQPTVILSPERISI